MNVVVVGKGSLIARTLFAAEGTASWRFIGHREALTQSAWLDGADVVINCAFDPWLKAGPYEPQRDVDLQLALRLPEPVHYVMLSSRLAYGPAGDEPLLREDRTPKPDRAYGINKLHTERALQALLDERLTVLRLSNIFGDEAQPGRQNFFAIALRSLQSQGRITLDMSPFVERDFLPAELLARALVRIAQAPQPGLYNIGAGVGAPTGRIAQWLIEGHGEGELLVNDLREYDAFRLDIGAAQQAFGLAPTSLAQVRQACLALGQRAARAVPQPA